MKRVIAVVAVLLSSCGADPVVVPARPVPSVTVLPSGVQMPAVIPDAVPETCNPKASLRPLEPAGVIPPDSTMARIQERRRLVVGVGSSAYRLSHRNPLTGRIEGFEADIAREIAKAIFGDDQESRIQFRALNAADRIAAVRGVTDNGEPVEKVDMVLAAMTMTCERWQKVAFSAEYFSAGQQILVPHGSSAQSLADLGGKKVCASATSTNIRIIAQSRPAPIPVAAANTSDCLLLLQQGQIDAVSTGDVILAGLAAQDPAMEIRGPRFTDEPTGIAMSLDAPDLVRFVNGVLAEFIRGGKWKYLETLWFSPQIADAVPPTPQYRSE
ncbi:polar amino acid transport system substrate-binding protein [Kibdelosporangium banguiense]|uniref:Polar amino acid transport system substrate-binding protein n=1 Tax=Kibdelosporangium banguiense TaxID=1365924 RepID=A0ABS4TUQ3_9PSEU|nr:glutamate ABC transporter substrate-binding protein [Kibdelosporangium banguiense]MBP2327656.1 polar amino acid transport system substrate-binding protein [Kibdelosporangium banguiense]